MNFERRLKNIEMDLYDLKESFEKQHLAIKDKYDSICQAYKEAEDFTKDFLKCCKKHKIKLVAINTTTELINSCGTYPFGYEGNVFADERVKDGWPAIWGVVEEMKISGGAGNTGQHQITREGSAKLVDGVYEYKNGKWRRLESI